jgi:hypothetical protein
LLAAVIGGFAEIGIRVSNPYGGFCHWLMTNIR